MLLHHTFYFLEQRTIDRHSCRWRGWCLRGVGGGAPLHLSASLQSVLGSPPTAPLPPELVPEAQRALTQEVTKKYRGRRSQGRHPWISPHALPHSATILTPDWATEEGMKIHRTHLLTVRTPPITSSSSLSLNSLHL